LLLKVELQALAPIGVKSRRGEERGDPFIWGYYRGWAAVRNRGKQCDK
jgi:hypothetical protein